MRILLLLLPLAWGQEEFHCPPGTFVDEVRSEDAFLEIQCHPLPAKCEHFEKPGQCSPHWRNRCSLKQYVQAIQRNFRGRRAKLFYRVRCCNHEGIEEQYVNQYVTGFEPEEEFKAFAGNRGSGLVNYLASIIPGSQRDNQMLVIGQLKCDRTTTTTTTTQQTTTTERRTTPTTTSIRTTPRRKDSSREKHASPEKRLPDSQRKLEELSLEMSQRQGMAPGGGAAACFLPSATILSQDNGRVPLDRIRVGDFLKVASESWVAGREGFSRVTGFLHRDLGLESVYLWVRTETGREWAMTGNHLLPAFACPDNLTASEALELPEVLVSQAMILASKLRIGDCVLTADRTLETVREIRKRLEVGAVAPVTEAGTVVVSGVRASCYSNLESQYVVHGFFSSWLGLSHSLGTLLGLGHFHSPPALLSFLDFFVQSLIPS